jgi:hypothetical protein
MRPVRCTDRGRGGTHRDGQSEIESSHRVLRGGCCTCVMIHRVIRAPQVNLYHVRATGINVPPPPSSSPKEPKDLSRSTVEVSGGALARLAARQERKRLRQDGVLWASCRARATTLAPSCFSPPTTPR